MATNFDRTTHFDQGRTMSFDDNIAAISKALDEKDRMIAAYRTALHRAHIELAALIPRPSEPSIEDWPVDNPADAECLQSAYEAILSAIEEE